MLEKFFVYWTSSIESLWIKKLFQVPLKVNMGVDQHVKQRIVSKNGTYSTCQKSHFKHSKLNAKKSEYVSLNGSHCAEFSEAHERPQVAKRKQFCLHTTKIEQQRSSSLLILRTIRTGLPSDTENCWSK